MDTLISSYISFIRSKISIGETAQLVKCLPCKPGESEVDPQSPCIRVGHSGVCLILTYAWDSLARQPVLPEEFTTRSLRGGGMTPVLISFSVALLNAMTKNLGGEKSLFHFTLPSNSLSLRRGEGRKPGQESGGRSCCRSHGGILLTGLLLMTCSVCPFVAPGTTSLEVPVPTVNWAHPYQPSVKITRRLIWWENYA